MPTTAHTRAAIYVKETAGYPDGENSKRIYGAAVNTAQSRNSRSSTSTPIPKEAGRNSAR